MLRIALAAIALLALTGTASAECACRCVNGQMQPICRSSIDLPPICPPTVCGIVPPAIPPIQSPYIPPLGTTQCHNAQVQNPSTGRYEWKQVCR